MNIFEAQDEKCIVRFTIDNLGKNTIIENEYDYDVTWPEVLSDIVQAMESFYGYSFDVKYERGDEALGIYYDGRDDD
jgi:hypothetical protein